MFKKTALILALILWSALIFSFSSQRAEDSASLSRDLARKVITAAEKIFGIDLGDADDKEKDKTGGIFGLIEHYLRKTAHFFMFLVLGFISSALFGEFFKTPRSIIIAALLYCLLYAASDEIHQLFVPGRAGMFRDVAIDFSGSLLGVFIRIKIKKH